MTRATRRGFLAAAGAGAATAAAAAAAPAAFAASSGGSSPESREPAEGSGSGEALVAHVADPRSGELSLLVGEDEVVVSDPDLVARLTRAARR